MIFSIHQSGKGSHSEYIPGKKAGLWYLGPREAKPLSKQDPDEAGNSFEETLSLGEKR
jgi:hypothetical protein